MIGDPATRYREDPVRIIRAVRFSAKLSALGFKLEAKTAKPLAEAKALLADVPQSRLFDEMLKLLQTGHALASIAQLKALGLAKGIYPLLDIVVERAGSPFVKAALADTDRRVGEGKPVAPSFLLACVLWSDVREGWAQRIARKAHPFPALQEAIDEVFDSRVGDVSGRGKLGADMREIWMMQPRFENAWVAPPSVWPSSRVSGRALTFCGCAPMCRKSTSAWPTGGRNSAWPTMPREKTWCSRPVPSSKPSPVRRACAGCPRPMPHPLLRTLPTVKPKRRPNRQPKAMLHPKSAAAVAASLRVVAQHLLRSEPCAVIRSRPSSPWGPTWGMLGGLCCAPWMRWPPCPNRA